jgi:beta-lactam-binding protein with PASTA domain
LTQAGLELGRRYLADDEVPEGYLLTTDPGPGTSLPRGSSVDFIVSTGRSAGATVVPAGTPDPGVRVAGQSYRPRPSATPFPSQEMTLVGDFQCLRLSEARSHIEEAGLLVGVLIGNGGEPPDDWLVHDQLPKAGEMVPRGSNVDLALEDDQAACP